MNSTHLNTHKYMHIESFKYNSLGSFTPRVAKLRIPSKIFVTHALTISYVTILALVTLYFLHDGISPRFTGILSLISVLVLIFTIHLYKWPLMYILRLIMLGVPGIITGAILLLNEPLSAKIAFHGTIYQTHEIAAMFLLVTSAALCSSSIGWGWAIKRNIRPKHTKNANNRTSYILYLLIAILGGIGTTASMSGYVWDSAYASETSSTPLAIGVYPAIIVIGVLGMYVYLHYIKMNKKAYVVVSVIATIYTLLGCMLLKGMRLEVLASIVAIIFLYHELRLKNIKPLRLAIFGVLIFIFMTVWGSYRFQAVEGKSFIDVAIDSLSELSNIDQTAITNDRMFNLGTIGDIATNFYSIYGLIDEGRMGYLYGKSYIEFIPRTLPSVIYPNRPEGLEWIFQDYGLTSGGGIFELAEAFANFGIIGVIFIPGFLTYCYARIFMHAIIKRTPKLFLLYSIVVSLFFRGIWYQNFAVYKSIITWIMLEILFFTVISILHSSRSRKSIA